MASHYGECHIRLRFTDYISRFTRLAAYQEFAHTGSTKIGYPSVLYRDGQLGSGTVFADESIRQREMWANGHRIDAWRRTKSYRLYTKVSETLVNVCTGELWLTVGDAGRIGLEDKNEKSLGTLMFSIKSLD